MGKSLGVMSLLPSAQAAAFVAGLEGVSECRIMSDTPSCTPRLGSLPPAGLDINSADLE